MIRIYKITNTVNNKVYVGITSLSLSSRLHAHFNHSKNPKFRLHQAIKKHGEDKFIIEELCSTEHQEEANNLERYWISKLNSTDFNIGYNMSSGGFGKSMALTEDTKNKISSKVKSHRDSLTDQERRNLTKAANEAKRGKKESFTSSQLKKEAQLTRWQNTNEEERLLHGKRSQDGISAENKCKIIVALTSAYSPAREPGVKKPLTHCPHCDKIGGTPIMKRYHFDKCKERKN